MYHLRTRTPPFKIFTTANNLGTNTVTPRVDTAPHAVDTTAPLTDRCLGWGSWSLRAARVTPRANVGVSPHPGRIISHPRIRNHSKSLQLQQPGDQLWDVPRSIPRRTVWYLQPPWLVTDWLGLMESARGESHPSGQRRGLTAPGVDKIPSPDQNSFL